MKWFDWIYQFLVTHYRFIIRDISEPPGSRDQDGGLKGSHFLTWKRCQTGSFLALFVVILLGQIRRDSVVTRVTYGCMPAVVTSQILSIPSWVSWTIPHHGIVLPVCSGNCHLPTVVLWVILRLWVQMSTLLRTVHSRTILLFLGMSRFCQQNF